MKGKIQMYAIVSTGGKQYKVSVDDVITVEKLEAEVGSSVELPVLFLSDGAQIVTDADELSGVKVSAEVLDQFKGKKELVFKFHKRKRYKRKKGHRQQLTKLRVTAIEGVAAAEPATVAAAE